MNINTVTKEAQTEIAALLPGMSKEDIRTFAEYFVNAWYQPDIQGCDRMPEHMLNAWFMPKHQGVYHMPEAVRATLSFWGVI